MKHTYSAGGVVINQGKVLVVSQGGRSWSLPKGHVEEGETELEAAKREIHEESGINQLELKKELGSYDRYRIGMEGGDDQSVYKTITMFLFVTEQHELKPVDPHNPEARWVEPQKVADFLSHTKDKEFFRHILQQIEKHLK